MNWIPRQSLKSRPLVGTFLGIGSPISAQIVGRVGFDWALIDTEHGAGGHSALVSQLQVLSGSQCAPIVRVPWNDLIAIKRALDAGAAGIMVPYVNNAAEAREVVASTKYPPVGRRGVAKSTTAANFGIDFDEYFAAANDNTFVIAQIETPQAAAAADEIAAVDGVDALFVGPLDLRVQLGWPDKFDSDAFDKAVHSVIRACEATGKVSGILSQPDEARSWIEKGMRLIAVGSDGMALTSGLQSYLHAAKRAN